MRRLFAAPAVYRSRQRENPALGREERYERSDTQAMLAVVIMLLLALLARCTPGICRNGQDANQISLVVRARGFELVDERGQVRPQIYLGEDGGGNIRLRDATGVVRIKLGASTQGYTRLLVLDEAR